MWNGKNQLAKSLKNGNDFNFPKVAIITSAPSSCISCNSFMRSAIPDFSSISSHSGFSSGEKSSRDFMSPIAFFRSGPSSIMRGMTSSVIFLFIRSVSRVRINCINAILTSVFHCGNSVRAAKRSSIRRLIDRLRSFHIDSSNAQSAYTSSRSFLRPEA